MNIKDTDFFKELVKYQLCVAPAKNSTGKRWYIGPSFEYVEIDSPEGFSGIFASTPEKALKKWKKIEGFD